MIQYLEALKAFSGRKGKKMRLDKYLKVSRIIKRRAVANEACDSDRVVINGRVAKASTHVKCGDIVEIKFGEKLVKFEIISVEEVIKKDEAREMYKILEES